MVCPSLTQPKTTILQKTQLKNGFVQARTMPIPAHTNCNDLEKKSRCLKKSLARSSSKKNFRKKTFLARKTVLDKPYLNKTVVAKFFRVARSTLYLKPRQPEQDRLLLQEVICVLGDNPHYGHRRVALHLGRNKKQILRIMKKYGLRPKRRRMHLRKPKDEKNPSTDIPNRLKQFCPIVPNVVWAGDFTYFIFYGTYVYLVTVIDLYTKEIVGVSIGLHHSAELVIAALEDARSKRQKLPRFFHSDQGSEYASQQCRLWLLAYGILPSHSHKGHPWENGCQESFFGRFKEEFGNIHRFKSLEEFMEAAYRQIYYYNAVRIHGKLKMPPREFCRRAEGRISLATKKHLSTSVS